MADLDRVDQVVDAVRDLLRVNITDPNTSRLRQGGEWIHSDFPRHDATTPRIGLVMITAPIKSGGMSDSNPEIIVDCTIQASTLVKKKTKWRVNSSTLNDRQLAYYLANQIITLVKNNQATWLSKGLLAIVPIGIPHEISKGMGIYVHVDLLATWEIT